MSRCGMATRVEAGQGDVMHHYGRMHNYAFATVWTVAVRPIPKT